MERVCHACGKHLTNAPALLVSGICFCYFHAKREYPIALTKRETNKRAATAKFDAERWGYLDRKSQAEAASIEYDRQCYKGVWRVINSPKFQTLLLFGILAFSWKFMFWFTPWLGTQIGIGPANPEIPAPVKILFAVVVLVGGASLLGYGLFILLFEASDFVLRRVRSNYVRIHPEPAAFTENPPVPQDSINSPPLLKAHPENEHYLHPAGSGYDRNAILRRDGFQCQCCGEEFQPQLLEVHHVNPRAKGGGDADTNLVTLCLKCHLIEDWFGHVHKKRREYGL